MLRMQEHQKGFKAIGTQFGYPIVSRGIIIVYRPSKFVSSCHAVKAYPHCFVMHKYIILKFGNFGKTALTTTYKRPLAGQMFWAG